jgi:hypothetical protein
MRFILSFDRRLSVAREQVVTYFWGKKPADIECSWTTRRVAISPVAPDAHVLTALTKLAAVGLTFEEREALLALGLRVPE